MAGAGPDRAALEAQAAATAPGRVRFLGSVADVRSVYAAADVVLLTSRTEGLPGVLIEAGLMGLPVIASDVGFIRDIVLDGRTGYVVSSESPSAEWTGRIRSALADPYLGRRARDRCLSEFEMGVVVQRWLALLSRVADEA